MSYRNTHSIDYYIHVLDLLKNQTFFSDDSAGPERVFLFLSPHEVFHASQHQQEQCLKHIYNISVATCVCLKYLNDSTYALGHTQVLGKHSLDTG